MAQCAWCAASGGYRRADVIAALKARGVQVRADGDRLHPKCEARASGRLASPPSVSRKGRQWSAIWAEAERAGQMAARQARPTPMLVGHETSFMSGVLDLSRDTYVVDDGVCGFASVVVAPARGGFVRWAKEHKGARPHHGGGCCVRNVHEFNQSWTRKVAFATAFADALKRHGIPARVWDALD